MLRGEVYFEDSEIITKTNDHVEILDLEAARGFDSNVEPLTNRPRGQL
jgi:hypothetical protein